VPGEHGHPGTGGPLGGFAEEPRLADSGVPGDQHRTRFTIAGTREHTVEAGEFVGTADEGRGKGGRRHEDILSPKHRSPRANQARSVFAQSAGTRPSGPGAG
jgi:hypothetical protein